jgi:acetyl-CoA acyltransferase
MKDLELELKEVLAGLRPVFEAGGSVTAGTHQMSDGAACFVLMSEEMVKELNLEPIARLVHLQELNLE